MESDRLENELFSGSALESRPLAARMAPETLDEFAGQEKILGRGRMLRRLIDSKRFSSAIFFGPPGCGKTALAAIISRTLKTKTRAVNAVSSGVADIKKILETARYDQGREISTLLIVDEIHHFNRSQQDALLPAVERGEVMLAGLTTENPSFYVNAALLSRVTAFEFEPLPAIALHELIERALKDEKRGLGLLRADIDPEAADYLTHGCAGDARRMLTALELAAVSAPIEDGRRRITLEAAQESIQHRPIRYDKSSDSHYDHISAFIKSMRGTDPDAAIYWMAKMLAAGEDPGFLARRVLVCAAEDVGLADFRALLVADAAFRAVESLGMPEARIPLAQAVIYVAAAPKSNSAYKAIESALNEVKHGRERAVPIHLRDSSRDDQSRGAGVGYPHPQDYMPSPVRFYAPGDLGGEVEIKKRLIGLRENRPE
ncbi:MAG: replication-associated recombination protein A [Elusimicrobiota bacterium]